MNKPVATIIAVYALTGAVAANAMMAGSPYIGVAFGLTAYDDDGLFSGHEVLPGYVADDLDDSGELWQIYGGYRFFKYLSVEGRYGNFGEYSAELSPAAPTEDADAPGRGIDTELSSLTVHGIGILPFGASGFDIYAQIGWGMMFFQSSLDVIEGDAAALSYGLGLRYTPRRVQSMTLQLAYDVYSFETDANQVSSGDTYDQNLATGSVGIQYNF